MKDKVLLISSLLVVYLCHGAPVKKEADSQQFAEIQGTLESVKKVLQDLNDSINKGETKVNNKAKVEENENEREAQAQAALLRVLADEHDEAEQAKQEQALRAQTVESDSQIHNDYKEKLTPADIALIKRMSSKVDYLEHSLTGNTKQENTVREATSVEEVEHELEAIIQSEKAPPPVEDAKSKRLPEKNEQDDPQLMAYINQLNPEDQKLVRKLASKLPYLKNALNSQGVEEDNETTKKKPEQKAPSEEKHAAPVAAPDETKTEGLDEADSGELTDFLQTLTKDDVQLLKKVKARLQHLKEALKTNSGSIEEKTEIGTGSMHEEAHPGHFEESVEKREHWENAPVQDNQLGTKNDFTDIENRLFEDINYAKSQGISMQELVKDLQARKDTLNLKRDERELRELEEFSMQM